MAAYVLLRPDIAFQRPLVSPSTPLVLVPFRIAALATRSQRPIWDYSGSFRNLRKLGQWLRFVLSPSR
jgi:hypothetical protein